MKPKTYRKKPVEIKAMRYAGSNAETHAVYLWVERNLGSVDPDGSNPGVTIDPADGKMVIRTLEGDMKADLGDYIIRGIRGEFYPCKPDIFERTYEVVE